MSLTEEQEQLAVQGAIDAFTFYKKTLASIV
ncbi:MULTISPECIES: hypothetical protein [Marinomonas]|uniref:Uncharacterized protein n=1 Tax=Marinomonas rhodophyticola TaxID=2992803 RepID=A0ABT3KJF5_9GAMM|nr:hypothetical protein [Marinomonas sp. KJ51-3]MCW4630544.1 hypothetical protein [Marinomonas sp. KJ51-3]